MRRTGFYVLMLSLSLLSGAACAEAPFAVSKSIAIGGEARWDYVTADTAAHRLYVSHGTQTEVIDTRTDALVGTIPDTPGVHGVAIARDLGLGFTSNGRDNSVSVFDLATLKVKQKIAVGTNPDAIIYVPQSQRLVTFNGKSKDATIVDAKTFAVLGTVAIGAKPEFAQLDKNGQIYFNMEDTNELGVLNPVAMTLAHRYSLKPCDEPTGLAVDPQQRFYSVCKNKTMMITGADGQRVAQAPIGNGSDGVAYMDGMAFSANGADGTISVIGETKPGKFEAIATVTSAPGARTIEADSSLHKLYLPTADFTAAKSGERRQSVPGSFKILVVEKPKS